MVLIFFDAGIYTYQNFFFRVVTIEKNRSFGGGAISVIAASVGGVLIRVYQLNS